MKLFYLFLSALTAASVIVHDTRQSTEYVGKLEHGVEHFRNVRYGQDTSGVHRFAPPRVYVPEPGSVQDGTADGFSCPQDTAAFAPWYSSISHISEDCLNLRIARPPGTNGSSGLPVLVWLHGGGGIKGSPYDPHYEPSKLIAQSIDNERPVIYVGVSYRLGIFGFARTSLLEERKSLNVGLRDQRLAFEWIRKNIETFGGDARRVTAFGQSAGGSFIGLHQLAYGGQHEAPFDQAFMLSGPPQTWLNQSSSIVEENTEALARQLDCDAATPSESLECLRRTSMENLLEKSLAHAVVKHPPSGVMTFTPTVDGDVLPGRSSELLRTGRFTKGIPSILSWTQDDGSLMVGPAGDYKTQADVMAQVKIWAPRWTDAEQERLFALYAAQDFAQEARNYNAQRPADASALSAHFFQASKIIRDLLFVCPSFYFGQQVLRHSGPEFDNVRLMSVNQSAHLAAFTAQGLPYAGASHCAEIPYFFAGVNPDGPLSANDKELARLLSGSLIEFAYNGNPVSGDATTLADWPVAYSRNLLGSRKGLMPEWFGLLLAGGELGNSVVSLTTARRTGENQAAAHHGAIDAQDLFGGLTDTVYDGIQQAMGDILSYTSMRSRKQGLAQKEIEHEKLFERCEFLNGLTEMLGV